MGRFAPRRALPAYAFVPGGGDPHPLHPGGHSHGRREPATALDAADWAACEGYLFGLDLFDAGFYWEAHEVWEGPWRLARGETAAFLKALIQLAVAGVKHRQGLPDRVRAHARRASELFRQVSGATFAGADLAASAALADAIARDGWPAEGPALATTAGLRADP